MKQESGKGTIKWIFIICVIIAVVFFIIQYVTGVIKREKAKELQADLLLVQAKVEIAKGKNNMNKDENPLKGLQVSKIAEKVYIKGILEKKDISENDFSKYYVLRNADLSEMDLQELVGKNSGSYIVNYENFDVIYTNGYENVNGVWCFKVSEMNKQPENPSAVPAVSTNVDETSKNENVDTNNTQSNESETQTENQNSDEKYNFVINKWKNIIK